MYQTQVSQTSFVKPPYSRVKDDGSYSSLISVMRRIGVPSSEITLSVDLLAGSMDKSSLLEIVYEADDNSNSEAYEGTDLYLHGSRDKSRRKERKEEKGRFKRQQRKRDRSKDKGNKKKK